MQYRLTLESFETSERETIVLLSENALTLEQMQEKVNRLQELSITEPLVINYEYA